MDSCKDEIAAFKRQVKALTLRAKEAEDAAAGKDTEIAELNEALEELEAEKRSEVSHLEGLRQSERGRLQQQHRARIGQV